MRNWSTKYINFLQNPLYKYKCGLDKITIGNKCNVTDLNKILSAVHKNIRCLNKPKKVYYEFLSFFASFLILIKKIFYLCRIFLFIINHYLISELLF